MNCILQQSNMIESRQEFGLWKCSLAGKHQEDVELRHGEPQIFDKWRTP